MAGFTWLFLGNLSLSYGIALLYSLLFESPWVSLQSAWKI
jgi:hypothetical protein